MLARVGPCSAGIGPQGAYYRLQKRGRNAAEPARFPGISVQRRRVVTVSAADAAPAAVPADAAPKKKKVAVVKPLVEEMREDIIPALRAKLEVAGVQEVSLAFENDTLEGSFRNGGVPVNFFCYFPEGKLSGQRGFSLSSHGYPIGTIEPFIIDEKIISKDLVVFWVLKRLFVQKNCLPEIN